MTIVGAVYYFQYDVHPKPKLIIHMSSFLLLGRLFYFTYMHIMALSAGLNRSEMTVVILSCMQGRYPVGLALI